MPGRILIVWLLMTGMAAAGSMVFSGSTFDPGYLKPKDSTLKVKAGQPAPDFVLPAIDGSKVRLSQFKHKKNVVLSFIPAAWTPVCSDQWPGYNLARPIFESHNAELLGISVDHRATLWSWTQQMGKLWFPVLSDFWPHGQVAARYGVLRGDGMAERALIFIDKQGIITKALVVDINKRPALEVIAETLASMQ